MTRYTLGSPEFFSSSQLRQYCNGGRTLIRPLANELRIASEELFGALREVPSGQGGMFSSVDSRLRARRVAKHLLRGAEGIDLACAGLVRTWVSFEREFLHNTPERSKKHFDLHN
ncbi:hypothetical protein [Amycolatopsis sp. NPDC054798]